MTIVRVTRAADSIAAAIAALNEQVLHTVSRRRIEQQELVRIEVSLAPFEILTWLDSQRESTKIYWRDRETGAEYAGVGGVETITVESFEDLQKLNDRTAQFSESTFRFFGGLPFDFMDSESGKPRQFGPGRFVLPGIEAIVEGDSATLACNISMHDSQLYSRLACLNDIDSNVWEEQQPITVSSCCESTTRESWNSNIERILSAISAGTIDKLVLARQVALQLTAPLNPWHALARLKAQSCGVSLFGFQFDDTQAFFGASPERLFRRQNRAIETEAIAGTISRGPDYEQDTRQAAHLLDSEKDRREHQLVVDYLGRSLRPLTNFLTVGETSILTLPHLHHLRTPSRGQLHHDVSDSDILSALHPTPAVAGMPRERSLGLLRDMESFDRGWYAGPVGWISADAAEFAVAIRSVFAKGNELILTAGAGIVEGSEPRAEWDETEQKMRSTREVILP